MTNLLQMIKKFLKNNYIIILGFMILSVYVWNRFFRERYTKAIPYQLENDTFVFLSITCIFLFCALVLLILAKFNTISLKETFFDAFIKNCLYELDFFIKKDLNKQHYIYEYIFACLNKQKSFT